MSDLLEKQNLDVLDLVQESVVVFAMDGRIKTWNSAAERLYGWNRHEVIGQTLKETVRCSPGKPPDFLTSQLPQSERWEGELSRVTKSGERVIVKSTWSLRRDDQGTPMDVVDTSVDITAERRMEEALRRAEYRYYNLFQAMAASFWELDFSAVGAMVRKLVQSGVTDLDGYFAANPEFVRKMIHATKVLDVNDQSVALFGSGNKDEVLGDLARFWPEESTAVFGESVAAAVAGKSHYAKEAKFCSLDGREYDTLFTACFPPEMLQRGKLLVGILDLTAAKKAKTALEVSERRYRNLFHLMPISLWQLDGSELIGMFRELHQQGVRDLATYMDIHPDFLVRAMDAMRVIEVNQRTVELVGAHDASELRDKPVTRFWSLSHGAFRQALVARFQGQTKYEAQIKVNTLDGRVVDVLFVAAFAAHLQEESISLVGIMDISDRVRAQEMLARVQAEFAHAARVSLLGELTASIAHEVNQPLTAILTNGEASLRWLGRESPDLEEVRELTRGSVENARRAADIIRHVRNMAIRGAPEKSFVPLNDVIDESLRFLQHEFDRKRIRTLVICTPESPGILGDRVQIQQVIVNLAINAMQAMEQNQEGCERRLTVTTTVHPPGSLRIEISDTGPGISATDLGRIFESFFTTKANGMGIGLPICRTIVEAHGGKISLGNGESQSGAVVTITLPLNSH